MSYMNYDPVTSWDVYCEEVDARERAMREGKTCQSCINFRESPDKQTEYGFCLDCGDYVHVDDSAEDCGGFG